jgi:hypothetical protein
MCDTPLTAGARVLDDRRRHRCVAYSGECCRGSSTQASCRAQSPAFVRSPGVACVVRHTRRLPEGTAAGVRTSGDRSHAPSATAPSIGAVAVSGCAALRPYDACEAEPFAPRRREQTPWEDAQTHGPRKATHRPRTLEPCRSAASAHGRRKAARCAAASIRPGMGRRGAQAPRRRLRPRSPRRPQRPHPRQPLGLDRPASCR